MDKPAVRDAALLIFRAVLGVVFVAHGVDKLLIAGMDDTIGQFSAWDVPQPRLSAWVAVFGEIIGGAMLVVGILTTLVAGALYLVHLPHGFFVSDNGIEYPLVLIVGLFMIVVFGSGRASIDGVLSRAEP